MKICHWQQKLSFLSLAASFAVGGACHAGIIWNEMFDGDFSGDRFAPTPLTLTPGDNELFGILAGGDGGPGGTIDRDYFTISIPAGHALSALYLTVYLSPDFSAFVAIQPGTIFPDDPDNVSPGDLLGWMHFGPNDQGTDLLPVMGSRGQGFTPPLPEGAYSFWLQQTDDYTDYALNFVVEEVPSPATGSVIAGMGFLAGLRRRRK